MVFSDSTKVGEGIAAAKDDLAKSGFTVENGKLVILTQEDLHNPTLFREKLKNGKIFYCDIGVPGFSYVYAEGNLSPEIEAAWRSEFKGKKIAFLQDEFHTSNEHFKISIGDKADLPKSVRGETLDAYEYMKGVKGDDTWENVAKKYTKGAGHEVVATEGLFEGYAKYKGLKSVSELSDESKTALNKALWSISNAHTENIGWIIDKEGIVCIKPAERRFVQEGKEFSDPWIEAANEIYVKEILRPDQPDQWRWNLDNVKISFDSVEASYYAAVADLMDGRNFSLIGTTRTMGQIKQAIKLGLEMGTVQVGEKGTVARKMFVTSVLNPKYRILAEDIKLVKPGESFVDKLDLANQNVIGIIADTDSMQMAKETVDRFSNEYTVIRQGNRAGEWYRYDNTTKKWEKLTEFMFDTSGKLDYEKVQVYLKTAEGNGEKTIIVLHEGGIFGTDIKANTVPDAKFHLVVDETIDNTSLRQLLERDRGISEVRKIGRLADEKTLVLNKDVYGYEKNAGISKIEKTVTPDGKTEVTMQVAGETVNGEIRLENGEEVVYAKVTRAHEKEVLYLGEEPVTPRELARIARENEIDAIKRNNLVVTDDSGTEVAKKWFRKMLGSSSSEVEIKAIKEKMSEWHAQNYLKPDTDITHITPEEHYQRIANRFERFVKGWAEAEKISPTLSEANTNELFTLAQRELKVEFKPDATGPSKPLYRTKNPVEYIDQLNQFSNRVFPERVVGEPNLLTTAPMVKEIARNFTVLQETISKIEGINQIVEFYEKSYGIPLKHLDQESAKREILKIEGIGTDGLDSNSVDEKFENFVKPRAVVKLSNLDIERQVDVLELASASNRVIDIGQNGVVEVPGNILGHIYTIDPAAAKEIENSLERGGGKIKIASPTISPRSKRILIDVLELDNFMKTVPETQILADTAYAREVLENEKIPEGLQNSLLEQFRSYGFVTIRLNELPDDIRYIIADCMREDLRLDAVIAEAGRKYPEGLNFKESEIRGIITSLPEKTQEYLEKIKTAEGYNIRFDDPDVKTLIGFETRANLIRLRSYLDQRDEIFNYIKENRNDNQIIEESIRKINKDNPGFNKILDSMRASPKSVPTEEHDNAISEIIHNRDLLLRLHELSPKFKETVNIDKGEYEKILRDKTGERAEFYRDIARETERQKFVKDYYGILGVDKEATPEEIKERYKGLVLKYHPDKLNENISLLKSEVGEDKDLDYIRKYAEEKFKDVSIAYTVISDPAKLAEHEHGRSRFGNIFDRFAIKRAPRGAPGLPIGEPITPVVGVDKSSEKVASAINRFAISPDQVNATELRKEFAIYSNELSAVRGFLEISVSNLRDNINQEKSLSENLSRIKDITPENSESAKIVENLYNSAKSAENLGIVIPAVILGFESVIKEDKGIDEIKTELKEKEGEIEEFSKKINEKINIDTANLSRISRKLNKVDEGIAEYEGRIRVLDKTIDRIVVIDQVRRLNSSLPPEGKELIRDVAEQKEKIPEEIRENPVGFSSPEDIYHTLPLGNEFVSVNPENPKENVEKIIEKLKPLGVEIEDKNIHVYSPSGEEFAKELTIEKKVENLDKEWKAVIEFNFAGEDKKIEIRPEEPKEGYSVCIADATTPIDIRVSAINNLSVGGLYVGSLYINDLLRFEEVSTGIYKKTETAKELAPEEIHELLEVDNTIGKLDSHRNGIISETREDEFNGYVSVLDDIEKRIDSISEKKPEIRENVVNSILDILVAPAPELEGISWKDKS